MISTIFYIAVPLVFLVLLLRFMLGRKKEFGATSPVLRYQHNADLDPYLKTRSIDFTFLPLLFKQEDYRFLQQYPLAKSEIHRLSQGRQAAMAQFLKQLRRDFEELVFVHRYLARHAEQLSGRYEWMIFRERASFVLRYARVRVMARSGFSITERSFPILQLVRMFEAWKTAAETGLSLLSPAQLSALQADLQLRFMQAEIT